MSLIEQIIRELNNAKRKSPKGKEYWMGRDLQKILGYSSWENFSGVIDKAGMACKSAGVESNHHFHETMKVIEAGKGAKGVRMDCYLSRYACYLIAMCGNTDKQEIGAAQTYFAVQTHRQERHDKLTADERRIFLRNRVKNANLSLASTAKSVGVQKYALFQNAGYLGLYEMGLSDIKKYKQIDDKENLLDRMGRTELAANEFRITQTQDKIVRENIRGEKLAIDTHHKVGKEIRNTIKTLKGIMPEDLSPEESIKKLERKRQKEIKGLSKKQLPNLE